jgi:peptidoglycan hydrolase FlgJ
MTSHIGGTGFKSSDGAAFQVSRSTLLSDNVELATRNLKPSPHRGAGSPELHKAFTDFVGQTFFGELLKQMRATVGKPAYMHGGMGEDIFQSQLDQVLVERITESSAATFSDPMYQLMMAPRS